VTGSVHNDTATCPHSLNSPHIPLTHNAHTRLARTNLEECFELSRSDRLFAGRTAWQRSNRPRWLTDVKRSIAILNKPSCNIQSSLHSAINHQLVPRRTLGRCSYLSNRSVQTELSAQTDTS